MNPFVAFVVEHPSWMLLFFPLIGTACYLWGRSHTRPLYVLPSADIVILEERMTDTEMIEHGELIDDMLNSAVVQPLSHDQIDVNTISIVPVTRIKLNRWKRLDKD